MLQFNYAQSFGSANEQQLASELDRITSIQITDDGKLLSVGDFGGRQIIFRNQSETKKPQYVPLVENNSYVSEYDPLRSYKVSSEIINQIFLPPTSNGNLILSCNEKDIKLHLLKEGKNPQLQLQKQYSDIIKYHINSLCLSPQKDTFLVGDDFDIYQYWLEDNIHCQKITSQHSQNYYDTLSFRTSTIYHPTDQNLIFSAFSDGSMALYDLRQSNELNKIQQKICNDQIHSINILAPNLIFTRTSSALQVTDVRNMQKQLFSLVIGQRDVTTGLTNMLNQLQANQNSSDNSNQVNLNDIFKQQQLPYTPTPELETYNPVDTQTPHQPRFTISFSHDKKFFSTGGPCQQIFVGNLHQDVINWKVTRILKKSKKNQNLGNINGKYVVKAGLKVEEKVKFDGNQIFVENQVFGQDSLICSAGGNLYVYQCNENDEDKK